MDSEPQLFLEPIKEFLYGITNSPLSAMAETFLQIVPEPSHFQVALSVLLPIMNNPSAKMESRIQTIFLLWYLYRNHSLDMNPFQAAFRETLNGERSQSTNGSLAGNPNALKSTLDMILSGQAAELAAYSPEALVAKWPSSLRTISPRSLLSIKPSTSKSSETDKMIEVRQLLMLASETVLSLQEQRTLLKLLPTVALPLPGIYDDEGVAFPLGNLESVIANNPGNASFHLFDHIIATSTDEGRTRCYKILKKLAPTLSNFDLWIRLIKDQRAVVPWFDGKPSAEQVNLQRETVGYFVRSECLVQFVDHCDAAIQSMEIEEGATEGSNVELDPGGTCALALQHFSKFCTMLLRMSEGVDGIALEQEMGEDGWFGFLTLLQGFALRHSKYEGPSELYRLTTRVAQRGG